jgi:hypothetical protein
VTAYSDRDIHLVLDHLNTDEPKKDRWKQHPTVRLHFTPTYSSWLNQAEGAAPFEWTKTVVHQTALNQNTLIYAIRYWCRFSKAESSGSILGCELRSHEHANREPTNTSAKADNFPAYCETGRVKAGYGCFSGFQQTR